MLMVNGKTIQQQLQPQVSQAQGLPISRQVQLQQAGRLQQFQAKGGLTGERARQREAQIERQRLEAEAQAAFQAEKVTIGDEQFTRAERESALNRIRQRILGQRVGSPDSPNVSAAETALLRTRPELTRALSSAAEKRIRALGGSATTEEFLAKELGFTSVKELVKQAPGTTSVFLSSDPVTEFERQRASVVVSESIARDLGLTGESTKRRLPERDIAKVVGFVETPKAQLSKQAEIELTGRAIAGDKIATESLSKVESKLVEKELKQPPISRGLQKFGSIFEKTAEIQRIGKERATTLQKTLFPAIRQPELLKPKQVGVFAKSIPFFTPIVGETLLIGLGAEKFVTKSGRAILETEEEKIREIGIGGLPLISLGTSRFLRRPTIGFNLPQEEITLVKAEKAPSALAIAEIGIGATGLAIRAFKPTTTLLPKPKTKTSFIEKITPTQKGFESRFKITSFEPARKAKVTTPIRKFVSGLEKEIGVPSKFRTKPFKIIDVTKPTTRVVKTLQPIKVTRAGDIIGSPQLGFSRIGRSGRDVGRFVGELRGSQRPFGLSEFSKLPSEQRFILQKAAEMKIGAPVPEKFVPQILAKRITEKQFGRGLVEIEKQFRVSLPKKSKIAITTFKEGRRITRGDVVTITEEAKTIGKLKGGILQTKRLPQEISERVLFSESFVKISPKPFKIARGQVSKLRGISIIGKPKLPPSPTEFIIGKGVQIQIPKVTGKAIKTLGEARVVATKALPISKPKIPTMISKRLATSKITQRITPAISAKQLKPSKIQVTRILDSTPTRPTITGRAIETPLEDTRPAQRPIQIPISKPAIKSIQKPVIKPTLKPSLKPLLKPSLKPIQKQTQKPLLKPLIKLPTRPTPTPPIVPTTTTTPDRTIRPPIIPKLKTKPAPRLKQGFIVEERRGGVFRRVGKKVFTEEAGKVFGAERTLRTLGATFRLVPTKERPTVTDGKALRTRAISRFREFTIRRGRAVKTPLQFIQKRRGSGGRLATIEERREIIFEARRGKKKDKKMRKKSLSL